MGPGPWPRRSHTPSFRTHAPGTGIAAQARPSPAPATISLTVRTAQDLAAPCADMSHLSGCFQDVWWTRVFTDLSHCQVCFTTFPSTSGKQIQRPWLPLDRLSSASSPLQSLAVSREKLQHACVHACTRLHTHREQSTSRFHRSAAGGAGSEPGETRRAAAWAPSSAKWPLPPPGASAEQPTALVSTNRKGTGPSAPTKIHASREPQNVHDSEFWSPEKKHPKELRRTVTIILNGHILLPMF